MRSVVEVARHGAAMILGMGVLLAVPAVAQQRVAQPPGQGPAPTGRPAPANALGTQPLPLPPGTPVVTLDAAEKMLMERNLVLVAARRGVDAARAQRLVAAALPPPQVTLGNTSAQFNETRRDSFDGGRGLGPQNNINVGLSVLVERGGKRTLRTRLAEENITVAETQVLDVLRGQLFGLRQNFLGALQARANLEVALANRASLDRTEALLRRQLRDGAIPEGDLLRFLAHRIQFEADVTNNAQAYAQGVAQVAALLAADASAFQTGAGTLASLGIAPSVPEAPAVPVRPGRGTPPGRGAAPAEAPTTVRTVLSPVAFDIRGRFDTIADPGVSRDEMAAAVPNRPDVVVALRQAGAAAANTLLAEAARSRDVTVGASWNRTRLPQNLPQVSNAAPYANNQFALSLSIPIFTRPITEGNLAVAAAQQGQVEAQARQVLFQARADFAGAWAGYEQARALLGLYSGGAVARAEEAYASSERAYLAGGRSLLDVMDALRTLNGTRTAANNARYAYLVALATLEQATGISGITPRL